MLILIGLVHVLAFASASACAGVPQPKAVPIEHRRGYAVIGPVTIEGRGGLRFLFDTGAQASVISPRAAARLGLRPHYRTEVVTAGGTILASATRAARLNVSGAELRDVELLIFDPPEKAVDGALGQNVLSQFNYLLDYRRRLLVFDPEVSNTAKAVPFEWVHGRAAVSAEGPWPGNRRLILDTGASDLVLFGFDGGTTGSVFLSTAAGTETVRTARVPRLKIGSTVLFHVTAAVCPPNAVRAEDGLLPGRMFRAIYINNREKYVVLNPEGA